MVYSKLLEGIKFLEFQDVVEFGYTPHSNLAKYKLLMERIAEITLEVAQHGIQEMEENDIISYNKFPPWLKKLVIMKDDNFYPNKKGISELVSDILRIIYSIPLLKPKLRKKEFEVETCKLDFSRCKFRHSALASEADKCTLTDIECGAEIKRREADNISKLLNEFWKKYEPLKY